MPPKTKTETQYSRRCEVVRERLRRTLQRHVKATPTLSARGVFAKKAGEVAAAHGMPWNAGASEDDIKAAVDAAIQIAQAG